MPHVGMNIDELRHLTDRLAQDAVQIGSAVASVSESLASTSWLGPDFAEVTSMWQEHRAALAEAATFLADASETVRHTADAQEAASRG